MKICKPITNRIVLWPVSESWMPPTRANLSVGSLLNSVNKPGSSACPDDVWCHECSGLRQFGTTVLSVTAHDTGMLGRLGLWDYLLYHFIVTTDVIKFKYCLSIILLAQIWTNDHILNVKQGEKYSHWIGWQEYTVLYHLLDGVQIDDLGWYMPGCKLMRSASTRAPGWRGGNGWF
jgi:hypothetical protein